MAFGCQERVLFCFPGKVIATRAQASRVQDNAWRDFPLQVEIVLQHVRELRIVSG